MYIDKKIVAIVLLTTSATWMVAANFVNTPAEAATVLKDRDYQIITGHVTSGGEALYVMDNRTGFIVVLTYDPNIRGIRPRSVSSVLDAFR